MTRAQAREELFYAAALVATAIALFAAWAAA